MADNTSDVLKGIAKEDYCYLTTTGRVTGKPHRIEIWFGARGNSIYLLSGNGRGSDWVKNMLKTPQVTVRILNTTFSGSARLVNDAEEEMAARHLLADKYQEYEDDKTLSGWAQTALVVGIDLNSILKSE
jgi:deazaflavin-dependent oxidoreductase (nitroreductase family)